MWRPVGVSWLNAAAGGTTGMQAMRQRPSAAMRRRVAVEAAAQLGQRARCAEGALSGGKLIEQRAEREEIAARIAALARDLLRRHGDPVAHRRVELGGQEIGQMPVARQAEIDER